MHNRRNAFLSGAKTIAPILLGVIPFALIAGVSAVEAGFSKYEALGMSTIVFAGAAQLAVVDLVGRHASVAVIVLTALIINLRFSMYSASLAPHFSGLSLCRRALLAYLLTDQAYAVSITAYYGNQHSHKQWFFFGAALIMWGVWQAGNAVGIFLGANIPQSWSLDFAVPLTFLALLFPAITNRPSLIAAAIAGVLALIGHSLPYNSGLVLAAAGGIAAGSLAEWRTDNAA